MILLIIKKNDFVFYNNKNMSAKNILNYGKIIMEKYNKILRENEILLKENDALIMENKILYEENQLLRKKNKI